MSRLRTWIYAVCSAGVALQLNPADAQTIATPERYVAAAINLGQLAPTGPLMKS